LFCSICQQNFLKSDLQTNNYQTKLYKTSSCKTLPINQKRGWETVHKSCLEIKKEKEIAPYLFAKVERLEKEIMSMKKNK